jgi:carboxypeptidase Q
MRKLLTLFTAVCLGLACVAGAQNADSGIDALTLRHMEAVAGTGMVGSHAFDYLAELSDSIGARVTGSPDAQKAIAWAMTTMRGIGLENVHAENWPLWRGWTRGAAEATLISPIHRRLMIDSMGWVGSTPPNGVDADVVRIQFGNLAQEIAQNAQTWAGKVLLVSKPSPQQSGSGDVGQGANADPAIYEKFLRAAYIAHAAAVIGGQGGGKSIGMHLTHTGILGFGQYFEEPVVSIAAEDQDQLERYIEAGKTPRIHMNVQNHATDGPVNSANVVGEIRGSEHPEQVIVVGGHLDSWDLASGATDNGCGVATTLGAAEEIVRSGIKPRRTIRFVLFTGEEQGLLGSVAYIKTHTPEMVNHVAAVILDVGQGPIVALNLGGRTDIVQATMPLKDALKNFGVLRANDQVVFGTDTGPFILMGLPGILLAQNSPDYGNTHHSPIDTLDKVDAVTLTKNAAVQGLVAFWIADRPDRLASPWTPEQTRKSLTDRQQEASLRMWGLWDLIGSGNAK